MSGKHGVSFPVSSPMRGNRKRNRNETGNGLGRTAVSNGKSGNEAETGFQPLVETNVREKDNTVPHRPPASQCDWPTVLADEKRKLFATANAGIQEQTVRPRGDGGLLSEEPNMIQKQYLTKREVMKIFGISRPTLWRWEHERGLRVVEIGGVKRIGSGDLESFLKRHESDVVRKTVS
jgi:hypothetical protein